MTTIHAYTTIKNPDLPHSDWRRAAALSIIPTSTGVLPALGYIPEMAGKLGGALRARPRPYL
jgi:glyceraldehyde-3-phosphate dehydrogenase/erythrose-4-phosphate dehydrogenase